MDNREAIEMLKQVPLYRYECELEKSRQSDLFNALNIAIQSIEELEQYKQGGLCLIPADVYKNQCELLDNYKELGTVEEILKVIENQKKVVSAQHETLKEYRELGTLERVREAVDKMKPRQPKCIDAEYGTFDCPSCGHTIIAIDDMTVHQNCLMCGQKLNWDFSD